MQTYGRVFARIYDLRWAGFAQQIAPQIRAYYESQASGGAERTLLDVGCGTGQLASHFLAHGYRVVGLDLSLDMLYFARQNNREAVEAGRAEFVPGDASRFSLNERFGLVVSTFDMLNHLPDEAALRGCFESVGRVLKQEGMFVFDLNTREGLKRWNHIIVEDTDDVTVINRGMYDGGERAFTRITGFVRDAGGLYERFSETFCNVAFPMERVRALLEETGCRDIRFAEGTNLAAPVEDPESLGRAFVIARR
jgi:SAM-dependent methyltransferase